MKTQGVNFLGSSLLWLLVVGLLTTSCSSQIPSAAVVPSPTPSRPIVQVVRSNTPPEKRLLSVEIIPQNNCGGTAAVSNELERSRTIARTIELGGSVSVNANGEAGIPGVGNVQVGAEIAATYGYSYGQQDTISRKLTVTAKEGSQVNHKIQQVEYWQTGEVIILITNKEVGRYPYQFRTDFGVELVETTPLVCPTSANTPTPTLAATAVSTSASITTPTNTPATTPITTPTDLQPTTISANDADGVGKSFEANGIVITLVGYNITSDGAITLQFSIANQGNNKVLLRYQNDYFSVSDDTNKVYIQTDGNLRDPKQQSLDPGASFTINSNDYPGDFNQIGVFRGMVPENASTLIVKIFQFADLRDMQWRIPLNAQATSPQSPAPGTLQPVLEGFSANGISVFLTGYDIFPQGAITLRIEVKNSGNNPVLLRYKNKYFSVQDDLGNKYEQTQGNIIDEKQVLLQPNNSFTFNSNDYPGDFNQIGVFHGMVPENASSLIVKISRFGDLRDMQWRIPLNAQATSPQTPAPGTLQPVLEGFSANGISVILTSYDIRPDGVITLRIEVKNSGNNPVLLRYQNKYFSVQDDLGNKYEQTQGNIADQKQVLLQPGNSFTFNSNDYPGDFNQIGVFHGKIPEKANSLIIKISQFGDLRDMQWRIPLK